MVHQLFGLQNISVEDILIKSDIIFDKINQKHFSP